MNASEVARNAALTRWAREPDRSAATEPAREALAASFVSDEDRRAWYSELARRSGVVRRRKARLRRLRHTRHLRLQVPVKWWHMVDESVPWDQRGVYAVRLAAHYAEHGYPADALG